MCVMDQPCTHSSPVIASFCSALICSVLCCLQERATSHVGARRRDSLTPPATVVYKKVCFAFPSQAPRELHEDGITER